MSHPRVRGIRGATTVPANTPEAIRQATQELLLAMVEANHLDVDDIVSIIFSASQDLNAAFPAAAARGLGWVHIPLLDLQQLAAPDLPRTLRILMHAYTPLSQEEIRHVYLGEAQRLRPDLCQKPQPLRPARVLVTGITSQEDVHWALEKGAHALGFVLEPKCPGYVNPEKARDLIQRLPPLVSTVGIFQDTPRYAVQELTTFCRLDWLLFLGEETPQDCRGYFQPVIKKVARWEDHRRYPTVAAFLVSQEEGAKAGPGAPPFMVPVPSLQERVPGAAAVLVDLKNICAGR
ncbi:MAG TPA: chorismate mutase [Clostridia bacterium]|nr:chorismate mutase [Clostridia bacterium]